MPPQAKSSQETMMTSLLKKQTESNDLCLCMYSTQMRYEGCISSKLCQLINKSNQRIPELWIFGYGSLIWKPGFEFSQSIIGAINGYVRRFWQGNTHHRGTVESPAAVATLVPCDGGETWGKAFCVQGKDQICAALDHVLDREVKNGGYVIRYENVHPYNPSLSSPLQSLVFYADPNNDLYIESKDVSSIANCICKSFGVCGSNLQYLLNLIEELRTNFPPSALDSHLLALEKACS